MALDIAAIQASLRDQDLDGWLLYDFHGSNPIASRIAGLSSGGHMTTRRWYYLIPATGAPSGLVHAIERRNLDQLPGEKAVYAGRQQLQSGLARLLNGVKRVAMEYSPNCAIPYLSRVDAGTAESVRAFGIDIRSSGDLVQQFEARWSPAQLDQHQVASAALYRIKDRTFDAVSAALAAGQTITEYDVQQWMAGWFAEEGLISDSAPVVAVGPHSGDPHYLPDRGSASPIVDDQLLLLDLWGKLPVPGAVFADITWVAMTSRAVPPEAARPFTAIVEARDRAVTIVTEAAKGDTPIRGFEVDRAARMVLEQAGFGAAILHRTGHSLGEEVHGNGAHLDDFETHDDRLIIAGTGFTVEPGLYFHDFGVRTEINVYRAGRNTVVTGERQMEIVTLR